MRFAIVVVGTSLGGLSALRVMLGELSQDFPLPIAVVQHRHKESEKAMSAYLQHYVKLPMHEAEDKEPLLPGHVYLAPADYHLLIESGAESGLVSLSIDAPVSYARPSIDVLFESAADAYGSQAVGIVLTGANQDGARGLARIKARGGWAIVQSPDTAESDIMPRAAIAATRADAVLPLQEIAAYLSHLCAVPQS